MASFGAIVFRKAFPRRCRVSTYQRILVCTMSSGNSTKTRWNVREEFDETGPQIVTRRPAVERLKLLRNIPLEEFRFAQSVAKKPV